MKGLLSICFTLGPLIICGIPANAQSSGRIDMPLFSSIALDYPVTSGQNGIVSLQGTAGQMIVSAAPSAQGAYPLTLGFWGTGVPYVYKLLIGLDGYIGDPTVVPLNVRLWNDFGELEDVVITKVNRSGEAEVHSWANPSYVATVSVKGDRWLRRAISLSPPADPFLSYPFAALLLLPGDLNDDNHTDRTDYNLFKLAFGSRPGDPNWNPLADLDGDGVIGRLDYDLFKLNFGKIGDN